MRKRNKLVCGVGVNDAIGNVHRREVIDGISRIAWVCPFYKVWQSMLLRCYSEKFQSKHETYIGCSVIDSWHRFSNFAEWMNRQPWHGAELDKDILFHGNKVYSPETCIFVSAALNAFVTDRKASRGPWPTGVCWSKFNKKFSAECRNPFTKRPEHLGYFRDPEVAHEAWRAKKHEHACRYADMQTDTRVANALRTRYAKECA